MRQVISNIQILRFAAAGCILLTHSADLLLPQGSFVFAFPWGAGVDLFFLISGFIMTWLTWRQFGEDGIPGRFLLRRAIRIVPPYWCFTTLMAAVVILAPGEVRWTRLGTAELVTSYAFLPWPRPADGKLNPILSQGWTLNYEAFFYVAFALALSFRSGLLWLIVCFVALAALHHFIPEKLFVLRFYSNPIILEFVAGIAIAHLYARGVHLSRRGAVAVIVIAGLTYLAMSFLHPFEDDRFLKLGVPAALVLSAFALVDEPAAQGRVRRVLQAAGDASYTLYLSHPFIVHLVAALAVSQYWHWGPWSALAFAIISAIATAICLYRTVERPATEALSLLCELTRPTAAQRVAP